MNGQPAKIARPAMRDKNAWWVPKERWAGLLASPPWVPRGHHPEAACSGLILMRPVGKDRPHNYLTNTALILRVRESQRDCGDWTCSSVGCGGCGSALRADG